MPSSTSTARRRRAPAAASTPARTSRPDGDITRQHILEIAGRTFAERGYADTTSKEICARAGTNMAAVNYHFGGKDGLYGAVLVEVHQRLLRLESLAAIAQGPGSARDKLARLIGYVVAGMTDRRWHTRVYARELLAPSPLFETMMAGEVRPKLAILKGILSEVTGIPPHDPALARCFLTVFAPCVMLLVANPAALSQVVPHVRRNRAALAEHFKTYALAGLDAAARAYRRQAALPGEAGNATAPAGKPAVAARRRAPSVARAR